MSTGVIVRKLPAIVVSFYNSIPGVSCQQFWVMILSIIISLILGWLILCYVCNARLFGEFLMVDF